MSTRRSFSDSRRPPVHRISDGSSGSASGSLPLTSVADPPRSRALGSEEQADATYHRRPSADRFRARRRPRRAARCRGARTRAAAGRSRCTRRPSPPAPGSPSTRRPVERAVPPPGMPVRWAPGPSFSRPVRTRRCRRAVPGAAGRAAGDVRDRRPVRRAPAGTRRRVSGDLVVTLTSTRPPTHPPAHPRGSVKTGVGGALGPDPVQTAAGVAALAVAAAGGTWLLHRRARGDRI